ncbi:MAG TPA: hypothetical protein VK922_01380 [Gemmatimonadaceae bacterium]|nr:hypothetical protein [Gemmatimonadaceae bacterium]
MPGTDPDGSALFAMAQESVAEANRLYHLADTALAAGQYNRAALLSAAIDGLQYGAPMHAITVTLDGVAEPFSAILLEDDLTENGAHLALARSLVAWSGASADRILIAYEQIDGPGFNAALFLDGGDAMFIHSGEGIAITRSGLAGECVYDLQTPLVGPRGDCRHTTMSATATVSATLGEESRAIAVSTGSLAGVRVSRALEDF